MLKIKKQTIFDPLYLEKIRTTFVQPKTDKILFIILLLLSFSTVVYIYLKADAPYDTGDGITHFLISKYSWKHPYLLLDLWGKPFFTLVSSPFAQFGLKGMYVFQALNATAISWFLFSIALKMKLKYAWLIPAFIFFAPVYFAVMNSGLVEVFFGTIFILSVWLVFNRHYYASALVASLIPFVRPEAYVVMPLLLAIYVYRKKFLAIPWLLTATLIYTLAGYAHYKDIFWIITKNYKLIGDNYSGFKGSYFHYFHVYDEIWGTAYSILLLLGIAMILYQVYRLIRQKPEHEYVAETFVLFLGSGVGCFILHSLLCGMPGILNNLGMLRYVAVLIPSSAIIALIGLNIITIKVFNKLRYLKPFIIAAVLFLVVRSSFTQWYYPFRQNNEQIVMKQMGKYIQSDWPKFKKICFLHPSLPTFADIDPNDSKKAEMIWSSDLQQINRMPDSTLILWDSHFMKGEGKIPFSMLSENPNFIMLKHYKFSNEELPFEACLFIRANNPLPVAVPIELVSPEGLISGTTVFDSTEYSFGNDPAAFEKWIALQTTVLGKTAAEFKPELEYGPVFQKKIADIRKKGDLKTVVIKFNLLQADTMKGVITVIEIKDEKKQISWEGSVIKQTLQPNQWNAVELQHTYTEPLRDKDFNVNIYLWNRGKSKFYIHDFRVTFVTIQK